MIYVQGYRGTVSENEARDLASDGIFVVNYLCVGCREHAEYAYNKMKSSFSKGKNIARKEHLELMLILSGRRQIKEAIALCGVTGARGIVAISEKEISLELDRDDSLISYTPEKARHLGISEGRCEYFFENSALLELER